MHKIILFLVVLAVVARASEIQEGIKNKRIERTIDLTSQFARHSVALEIENKGSKAASIYVFTLEETVAKSLATLEAIDEQTGNLLAVQKEAVSKGSYVSYTVTLAKSLAPQSSAPIRIKFVLSRSMTPFPSVINQDEKQLVRYYDNHFVFTPYPTGTQTTTVKLPTSFIESKSEQAPTSVSGSTITYGPYEDVAPLSRSAMSVHFENNKPFIAAHQVVKEIEVSHWGSNVAIEETYDLEHVGAKLKGTFSRFDYQRTPPGKGSVVASFKQVLPAGASDVYYRDEIGNISTSHLFEVPTGPVMDVIPRFPLFGGWKIGFYFGYNLPTSSYLFTDYNDKSTHVLNVTFASNLNDIAIEELVVRVILPEGSKNIQVHTPFAVDSQTTETHFTYLDTAGRPVLVLTKKNVVPEHNKPFQVVYTYNTSRVLQEPFLLIGAYFFFFVLFMVYSRISIKIGPSTKGDDS